MDIAKHINNAFGKFLPDVQFDYTKWNSILHYNTSNVLIIRMEKLQECLATVSDNPYYQKQWNRYLMENPYMDVLTREKFSKISPDILMTHHKNMVFLSHFLRFSLIVGIYKEPILSVSGNQILNSHYYLNNLNDIIIRYGKLPTDSIKKSTKTEHIKNAVNISSANPENNTVQDKEQFTPKDLFQSDALPSLYNPFLIDNSIAQIPAYHAVSERMKEYAKPYQEYHILMGKNSHLNDFECYILQLVYQINVLFEEDIRVILNIINTDARNYSLITTIRKLKQMDYLRQHTDDTYGKYFSYTAKAERLLNNTIKSPDDFNVSRYIERYRLISSYTTLQLTAGLKEPYMENLKKRISKISFGNHGVSTEMEKSRSFFYNIKMTDGKYVSVLDIEEEYTKLMKTKITLASQNNAIQKKMKEMVANATFKKEATAMMEQSKFYDEQISAIDNRMKCLRMLLGDNYIGLKKETVPTLYYFLKSGIVWNIKTDGSSYVCNITYLDFSLYGNQDNLYQKILTLSAYFQNRLNTSNFYIRLSLFRADDERKKEYEYNVKKALTKVDIARASGNRLPGIDRDSFTECRNGKEHYRIYNILTYYPPYKDVISLRIAERDYKKQYYQRTKESTPKVKRENLE